MHVVSGTDSFTSVRSLSGVLMDLPAKITVAQPYSMVLFRLAVHPEFFQIDKRLRVRQGTYDFESWVFQGGHALRFEADGTCVTEVITPSPEQLPERGHVATLPCGGERDHDQEFGDRVSYITSMQTESLSDHLYADSFQELKSLGEQGDARMVTWIERGGQQSMSMVDLQRYNDELHAQGYHLRGDTGLVLRTQTIFDIKSAS